MVREVRRGPILFDYLLTINRAMAIYEPRVTEKVDSLLSKVAAHSGTPMNMTNYIMFFGFDVMGEVGKFLNALKSPLIHE